MSSINVQFSDETEATIIAYFGCPQDATAHLNQAIIATSDARWATFYNALPSNAQKAMPAPGGS